MGVMAIGLMSTLTVAPSVGNIPIIIVVTRCEGSHGLVALHVGSKCLRIVRSSIVGYLNERNTLYRPI